MAVRDVDVGAVLARLGIEARRRGKELWACCPFHDERTPSWSIRDEPDGMRHGYWKCLGACADEDNHGGVVELVRRALALPASGDGRDDAWRWIKSDAAGAAPRPLPLRIEVAVVAPRARLALPRGVVVAPIAEWVGPARRYLVEGRGVPQRQADLWRLGYAVDGRMGGRIVFPIRDRGGRLLSYTGRTYVGSALKWREPDKDENADKSAVFGEERWPAPDADGRRPGSVVVAEAALDALAVELATEGAPVGAIYGSELLPGHVARLATWEEVVVASDPDPAGDKLWRALRAALARWTRCRRAAMPAGLDASALGRRSPDLLREAVGL